MSSTTETKSSVPDEPPTATAPAASGGAAGKQDEKQKQAVVLNPAVIKPLPSNKAADADAADKEVAKLQGPSKAPDTIRPPLVLNDVRPSTPSTEEPRQPDDSPPAKSDKPPQMVPGDRVQPPEPSRFTVRPVALPPNELGQSEVKLPAKSDEAGKASPLLLNDVRPSTPPTNEDQNLPDAGNVSTKGDEKPTGNDVSTKGDEEPTGKDAVGTKGDEEPTGKDVSAKGDEKLTGKDAVGMKGDEKLTGKDVSAKGDESPAGKDVCTEGDEKLTGKDTVSTEGDEKPTGKDAVSTKGDEKPTGKDVSANGDEKPTGKDVSTNGDEKTTGKDAVSDQKTPAPEPLILNVIHPPTQQPQPGEGKSSDSGAADPNTSESEAKQEERKTSLPRTEPDNNDSSSTAEEHVAVVRTSNRRFIVQKVEDDRGARAPTEGTVVDSAAGGQPVAPSAGESSSGSTLETIQEGSVLPAAEKSGGSEGGEAKAGFESAPRELHAPGTLQRAMTDPQSSQPDDSHKRVQRTLTDPAMAAAAAKASGDKESAKPEPKTLQTVDEGRSAGAQAKPPADTSVRSNITRLKERSASDTRSNSSSRSTSPENVPFHSLDRSLSQPEQSVFKNSANADLVPSGEAAKGKLTVSCCGRPGTPEQPQPHKAAGDALPADAASSFSTPSLTPSSSMESLNSVGSQQSAALGLAPHQVPDGGLAGYSLLGNFKESARKQSWQSDSSGESLMAGKSVSPTKQISVENDTAVLQGKTANEQVGSTLETSAVSLSQCRGGMRL